jgi:hypothetical protein
MADGKVGWEVDSMIGTVVVAMSLSRVAVARLETIEDMVLDEALSEAVPMEGMQVLKIDTVVVYSPELLPGRFCPKVVCRQSLYLGVSGFFSLLLANL